MRETGESRRVATEASSPRHPRLTELFEKQVGQRPEAVAVLHGDDSWSYRELHARSGRLAHHLHTLGVGPEALVGVAMERSPQMVAAMLAIFKAGGAYLPLDPKYPAERMKFLIGDSAPLVVLTQERVAARFGFSRPGSSHAPRVILLDGEQPAVSRCGEASPPGIARGENLAYVIYTSGSTGRPKGVGVSYRAAVEHLLTIAQELELGPADRVLQFASPSFDASLEQILATLVAGAAVVLRDAELWPASEFFAHAASLELTVADLPTSYWHLIAAEIAAGRAGELPSGLRLVWAGGELMLSAPARRWSRHGGGRLRLLNGYGPTEATITATTYALPGADAAAADAGKVPIGRPLPGRSVRILDPSGTPVAPGDAGELGLGGKGLARGYLNRPALTAERFQPDPLAEEPGARLYLSGDRGRRRADGEIEFLGRLDEQVKVRGFRIELGEVEAALERIPELREAAVAAVEEASGSRRLVACVVTRRDGDSGAPPPGVDELRAALRTTLPEYMVPASFVGLDELPRLPSGKVDRRALKATAARAPTAAAPYTAPRNALEETLAAILAELLGTPRVGVYDDVFALGAHSLVITQLTARVRQSLGLELGISDAFELPTVAALAGHLEASQAAPAMRIPPIRRAPRDQELRLSFAQEQVWFLSQLVPDNVAYNVQIAIRWQGPLKPRLLELALSGIVRRHEILRTSFPAPGGRPVQEIHPPYAVSIPRIDLRALPAGRREREARRGIAVVIREPFDVTRLPLARWLLWRLGDEDHLLLQVEHHFVHDGWSIAIVLGEMRETYAALAAGRRPVLPEPPVQYVDFVHWQREWMQGEVLEAQLRHWRQRLEGAPAFVELPTDRPRPTALSLRGDALLVKLPAELYAALQALSRREGVTLFTVMLASFNVLLCRATGQEDLPVGSGFVNRRLRELERLIGMVVNAVVLRANLKGTSEKPRFRELLARTRRMILETHSYQDLPFEKLVEALQPERHPGYNPLFQFMFGFHDSPVPDFDMAGLRGTPVEFHNGSAKTDLNVICIPRSEQRLGRGPVRDEKDLTVLWEYRSDLFGCDASRAQWARSKLPSRAERTA